MGNNSNYSTVDQGFLESSVTTSSTEADQLMNNQSVSYQTVTNQSVTTQPVTTQPVTTQPVTTQPVTTQPVTTQSMVINPPAKDSVTTKTNAPIKKLPPYVHPFITMINEKRSEGEMINTLQAFCGGIEIGTDDNGNSIYEMVDQVEFIAPVLEVFSYCANNEKKQLFNGSVKILYHCKLVMTIIFVILNVSSGNITILQILLWHTKALIRTMEVLENLLERNKYAQFKHCMKSPFLLDEMNTYKFTFVHYIDNDQFSNVSNLLRKIKQRLSNKSISITDKIYPNPKLAKLQSQNIAQVEPVVQPIVEPVVQPIIEPVVQPIIEPVVQPVEAELSVPVNIDTTMTADTPIINITIDETIVSNNNIVADETFDNYDDVTTTTIDVPVNNIAVDETLADNNNVMMVDESPVNIDKIHTSEFFNIL